MMMKKKIIVLVLVFGLASAANADLFFTVGGVDPGAITLDPVANPTITLEISGDGQTPSPHSPWVFVQGKGSINGGNALYAPAGGLSDYLDLEEAYPIAGEPSAEALLATMAAVTALVDPVDLAYIILADAAGIPAPLEGVLVDGIVFTCTGQPGDVTLTLFNDTYTAVLDTLTIKQVPEPITFALLGLGGLFLRRRK